MHLCRKLSLLKIYFVALLNMPLITYYKDLVYLVHFNKEVYNLNWIRVPFPLCKRSRGDNRAPLKILDVSEKSKQFHKIGFGHYLLRKSSNIKLSLLMSEHEKIKETLPSDDENFQDALSKPNEQIIAETIEEQAEPATQYSHNLPSDNENVNEEQKEEIFKDCVDDFIDEEVLLEMEKGMTEEQKLFNKQKADDMKLEGNHCFKEQNYDKCIQLYTSALRILPSSYRSDRAILFANRAAAKMKIASINSAIDDCTKAIELDEHYVKAWMRRAKLYEEIDKLDESLEDYKQIVKIDCENKDANEALLRLPTKISERNEKLKEEMIDKLKDLGNMVLKPFGLSTANFELKKTPGTEGYSINFKQSPN